VKLTADTRGHLRQLLWLHLFLGLTLAGPVVLKLASTGYRFAQSYLGVRSYRRNGPPATALRMLAPRLILCTLGVLATGLSLLILGPSSRQPVLLLHKVFFFGWLAVRGIHVLAHMPDLARARQARRGVLSLDASETRTHRSSLPGAFARGGVVISSVLVGLALAGSLTGLVHVWTG
jgi:hypothetical protein